MTYESENREHEAKAYVSGSGDGTCDPRCGAPGCKGRDVETTNHVTREFKQNCDTSKLQDPRNSSLSTNPIYFNGDAGVTCRSEESVKDTELVPDDVKCGFGRCKPDGLQVFNNPRALLFFICCFVFLQGLIINGVNNVNTTTLERRFQLSSSKIGLIPAVYDVVAAFLGLAISYFGSGDNKSRWLTISVVLMGIGCLIFSLPHFTTDVYQWGQNETKTCSVRGSDGPDDVQTDCPAYLDVNLQNYLYVLLASQVLTGIGGSAIYTIAVGYIDDSVHATSSPLYIGIMTACATAGPGLGYIVGGQLLDIYVDIDKMDGNVGLRQDDPRWVGAWWLCYLVAAGMFLGLTLPFAAYGRELPSAKIIRETRVSQTHSNQYMQRADREGFGKTIKDLPASFMLLLRNPTYMLLICAGASESVILGGFAVFMPKFVQNQFGVSASRAGWLSGLMVVPGGGLGLLTGGFICQRFRLHVKGMLRLCIIGCLVSTALASILWIRCDNTNIVGLDVQYDTVSNSSFPGLHATCNNECHCNTRFYEPVCTEDGTQYFSPCFAGCNTKLENGEVYEDCNCVEASNWSSVSVTRLTADHCESGCNLLYVFLPLLFLTMFFMFMEGAPDLAIALRCIHDKQRTFGLGFKAFVARLLGSVPGPFLFGALIDSACLIWQPDCGGGSACWVYDIGLMSRNYFLISFLLKVVSSIFFILAHSVYKPPLETNLDIAAAPKLETISQDNDCTQSEYGSSFSVVSGDTVITHL